MTFASIGSGPQLAGALVLALAVAARMLATRPRTHALLGLAVLFLAPAALAASVIGEGDATFAAIGAGQIVLLGLAAAAAVAVGAAVFVRRPAAVLPAAMIALSFRLPLEFGGETVKLLVPLYGVIAAAVVAVAWRELAPAVAPGAIATREGDQRRRRVSALDVALAVTLVAYAAQALYAPSAGEVATRNLAFFYAPFAMLYGLAADARWTRSLARACFYAVVGVAVVLTVGGFIEYLAGEHLITPGGIAANEYDPYFRVQSLFFDPNMFGRFLAITMLLLATVLLFTRRRSRVALTGALLAVLWVGLVLTLSQSSMGALLAGLAVLAALRWRPLPVVAVTGAAAIGAIVFVLAAPGALKIDGAGGDAADRATSGRFGLVSGGLRMFADQPLFGVGSGGFSAEFARREDPGGARRTTTSHTTPVTVAAEQGLAGLAIYGFLLWCAFGVVFRAPREIAYPGATPRIAVAALLVALTVHSLAYAAFLEDPLTWVVLGTAVSLAGLRRRAAPLAADPVTAPTPVPA